MAFSETEGCSFFHSFPRFSSAGPDDELRTGLLVLRSILASGLLLCPERIFFPFTERGTGGTSSGSFVYQTRASFTYLRKSEIFKHSCVFGAFSLEFDIAKLRRAGAIPVVYIPQPVTSNSRTGYDHFANNIVHQLRDASTLLSEIHDVMQHFEAADRGRLPEITVHENGHCVALDVPSVHFILNYLRGEKGNLINIHSYLEAFANLFYHVDSAREHVYFRGVDLEYYRQMEWRIFSGLRIAQANLDRELSPREMEKFESISPFFKRPVEDKDGKSLPRSRLSRLIQLVDSRPFNHLIERIWTPDVSRQDVELILQEQGFSLPVSELSYSEIKRMRRS